MEQKIGKPLTLAALVLLVTTFCQSSTAQRSGQRYLVARRSLTKEKPQAAISASNGARVAVVTRLFTMALSDLDTAYHQASRGASKISYLISFRRSLRRIRHSPRRRGLLEDEAGDSKRRGRHLQILIVAVVVGDD